VTKIARDLGFTPKPQEKFTALPDPITAFWREVTSQRGRGEAGRKKECELEHAPIL